MAWLILIGAGLLEIVWATALKNLPVGTAYAVWVGIGVTGVAVAGMLAFGESASPARLGFIA